MLSELAPEIEIDNWLGSISEFDFWRLRRARTTKIAILGVNPQLWK
jgi:hypothetical protein